MFFSYPLLILSLFLSLALGGCAPAPLEEEGRYIPPENPGGRMCIFQCSKALGHCLEGCDLQKRACFVGMQTQAIKDYEFYMREQFLKRLPMDLRESDFERPEKCAEMTCHADCEVPYNLCYKKCGGEIVGTPHPTRPLL